MYKVVGLDLDNTLTKIDTTLDIISRELSIDNLLVEDVKSYNLFNSFGINDIEKEASFWANSEEEIIKNSILSLERYNSIIENFCNKDTIFHIITSRNSKYRDLTIDWLNKNDIVFDKIVMTGGEPKVNHIKRLGIELMVDDAPNVINDLNNRETSIDVLKVQYPYNKDLYSKYILDLDGNVLTKK